MELTHKTNEELFSLYDAELLLRAHNARNLDNERRLLSKFHQYLNSYPPSPELAKGFLSQYASRGFYNGGRHPYGYVRVKVKDSATSRTKLEPDPKTAPITQRIFRECLAGKGA